MKNPEDVKYWSNVKKALAHDTQYSLKIAIIEANSIFLNFLRSKGIKVKHSSESFNLVAQRLSAKDKLKKAIQSYNEIINGELAKDLTYKDAKEYIGAYYQAMIDIKDFSAFEVIMNQGYQLLYRFSHYIYNKFIYIILGILAFLALVVILNDTSFGEAIVDTIVNLSHKILFSIIPAIAVIMLVGMFIAGYYLFNKRKSAYSNTKIIFDDDIEEEKEL